MIDFKEIKEETIPHFLGGEGEYITHMFNDGDNKIMKSLIKPGSSVGFHKHETSSEIIYILFGSPKAILDGKEERLHPGDCHYCKKGQSHTLVNDTNEDVTIFAVVCNQ